MTALSAASAIPSRLKMAISAVTFAPGVCSSTSLGPRCRLSNSMRGGGSRHPTIFWPPPPIHSGTLPSAGAPIPASPSSKVLPPGGTVWRPETHKLIEWGRHGVLVTRPWPKPQAWARSAGENAPWHPAAGHVYRDAWNPAVRGQRCGVRERAQVEAWCSVPDEVQQVVVASTVLGREWWMLNLVARCPGAMELGRSVPLLAGALSIANRLRPKAVARPLRSARSLLGQPDGMARWRRIAAWLGFDGSRSFIEVLRRATRPRPWSELDLVALRDVWKHPLGRKRLRHARRIDPDVVHLLRIAVGIGYIERLRVELVDAAYAGGGWGGTARHFEQAVAAWQRLHPDRPLPQWRSAEALEADALALHGQVCEVLLRPEPTDAPFPPPPLPASEGIRPLDSPEALAAEATGMGHCLDNEIWEWHARMRRGYGYAVEAAGERATLWVERAPSAPGGFELSQLRGPGNVPPAPPVVRLVNDWMSSWSALTDASLPEVWVRPEWVDDGDDIPF